MSAIIEGFTLEGWHRFMAKVDLHREDGCWTWMAHRQNRGYGTFAIRRKKYLAHRISWEWSTGKPIPEGLVIDHLCRNKACVRPDHLEPVTDAENRLVRGVWRDTKKDECHRGHPMSGENLYVSPKGRRNCRACQALREAKYRGRA